MSQVCIKIVTGIVPDSGDEMYIALWFLWSTNKFTIRETTQNVVFLP